MKSIVKKTSKYKILVLSANFGSGHHGAALSLIQNLKLLLPDIDIQFIEAFTLIVWLDRASSFIYRITVKWLPVIYGFFYNFLENANPNYLRLLLRLLGSTRKLRYLIKTVNPDVVICTHNTPLTQIAALKNDILMAVPCIGITTDYYAHRQWLFKNIDMYFVGSTELKKRLLKILGVKTKVIVSGIPISSNFDYDFNNEDYLQIRQKYNLINIPTILIMGGLLDMVRFVKPVVSSLITAIRSGKINVQLIVVCGKNHRLYHQISKYISATDNIVVLEYTDKIYELMSIADLLITKSGGLTVTEALIKELPMLIYNPIPGQEKHNAYYLQSKGAAIVVNNELDMVNKSILLIESPSKLKGIRNNIRLIKKPNPAKHCAEIIIDTLDNKQHNRLELRI